MSGTVDLMVVGMAEQMSADELSNRLVKEFKQPADAFDALVSAATGAGPAYAAQSGVSLDLALEGKDKLESLGLVCNIPGFTDTESANSAVIADAAGDQTDAVDETDLTDLEFASADDDSVSAEIASDAVSANDDPAGDSDDDLLASFDELSFDETSPEDSAESHPTGSTESSTEEGDAEVFDLDFGDELSAIGSEPSASEATDVTADATQSSVDSDSDFDSDDLDFGESLEELAVDASSAAESQALSEAAESIDDLDTLDNVADVAEVETEPADASGAAAVDSIDSTEIDISDIALSEDDGAPLTRPRESANVELDDGGLSLASDDSIAPIKASATDVPAALANRSAADADELSLSLDDSSASPESGAAAASVADAFAVEESDTVADLMNESDESNSTFTTDASDESGEDSSIDSPDVSASDDLSDTLGELPALEEQVEAPSESFDDDAIGALDTAIGDVDSVETLAEPAAESTGETTALEPAAEQQSEDPSVPAQIEEPVEPASEVASSASEASVGGAKSIAEELIESLQGAGAAPADESEPAVAAGMPGSTDSTAETRSSFVVDDEEEQLRKSREQVAVLQEKIEEDLVEEEQVYQEFEQIAKQRTAQKTVAGVAAVAAIAAIGAGVHFSGLLSPSHETTMPATVAAVEPQRDHEQESLNAAIERSATLINPENLSTEELLMSLAQGSGQDTLGDLRRYILGGSASRVAKTDDSGDSAAPRVGAAIPADSDSMKLLKNRVAHSGDKYFDKWSRREIDLRLYIELVDRLIDAGDIVAATELCNRTKDNLFAVMGKQSVARAYKARGDLQEALDMLQSASRSTYSIASAPERVVAMADYAYSEHKIGQREDALDSYLSVSILAASLNRSEYKTIGHAAVSDYLMRAGLESEGDRQLSKAIEAAHELPGNSAARDLALRHIALTQARMGLFEDAIKHTDAIIDPFASVSAYHGIALEYEARKDYAMATEVIQKAFDASSVIADKEKRRQLLSKIQLANTD